MKTWLLIPVALAAGFGAASKAAAQSAADRARQGTTRQEQIQAESQKLISTLESMADEYKRNGLGGDEIKNLKNLQATLTRLSDKEMEKILVLLRDASAPADPKSALQSIADAYSKQKGVLIALKQVLAAFNTDQEGVELANQVKELAERQAANLQTGIETAQWSLAGVKPDEGTLEASVEGQAAEQQAISDESKLLQAKIAEFAKKPGNKAMADRFKKGLEESGKIASLLDASADSLAKKKLFEAVATEKAARDQLRQLARTIAPPREDSEVLREASQQVDKMIAQQKELIKVSEETKEKPIEEWIAEELGKKSSSLKKMAKDHGESPEKLAQDEKVQKMYENYKKAMKRPLDGLENRQGELVSQSDTTSQDLAKLAKPAAEALHSAIEPMQNARAAFKEKETVAAVEAQKEALAAMEKSKAALQQQLAAAEKAEQLAGDPIAALQEVKKQTEELLQEQNALAKTTAAPKTPEQAKAAAEKQEALQQKANQLQQQAASDAPAAAKSLAGAAGNMQQASNAMNAANSPAQSAPAQAQQQQASQNLAKASEQLGQQINQLEQTKQELAAAEKALDELAKIIETQQKLRLDTVQAEKQQQAVRALAPRQQGVRTDTAHFKETLAAAKTPQANGAANTKALTSADGHMGAAHGHLGKGDGQGAGSDQEKALADLFSIKNALDAQVQAAQAELGTEADADASTAQAAAAVAEAQAQLSKAQSAMGDPAASSPAEAAKSAAAPLAQAAKDVGGEAAKSSGLPGEAQQAMEAASNALSNAAGQAAAGDSEQAQASGQKAADALAKAATALAQAQAGIASAGTPGSPGSPGAPGTPGAPAQKPGVGPSSPDSPGTGDPGGQLQIGGEVVAEGQRGAGKSQFLGLPQRDRATIQQAQSEKYPQEYATKVEQYLRNLADESSHR